MSRRFGIRLSGCEGPLEDLIKQHVATCYTNPDYTLIEIGSAGCTTLRAFRDIMVEARGIKSWRAVGFDLPPDKAWSLNMDEINQAFDGKPCIIDHREIETLNTITNSMVLILLDDPRAYIRDTFLYRADFVFIDASHGKSCGYDFLAVENKVAPGGLVVFHDYGELEQGTDWQAEDREFISVRSYVHRLGLASPCPEPRKGWRFIGEIKGSRHWGGDGNSCAVVQRTNDPLEVQPKLSLN